MGLQLMLENLRRKQFIYMLGCCLHVGFIRCWVYMLLSCSHLLVYSASPITVPFSNQSPSLQKGMVILNGCETEFSH